MQHKVAFHHNIYNTLHRNVYNTLLQSRVIDLTATDNGENQVEGPQAGQTEHCEVCLDKELTGGVMAFGVLTILLTNAASVFLHLRAKRLKKKETTETFRHGMQKNSAQ